MASTSKRRRVDNCTVANVQDEGQDIFSMPMEIPILTLSGDVCCTLNIESLGTRIAEMKVMVEQSTGIPRDEQALVPEGRTAAMDDRCRLYHYADALYGSRRMTLIRKIPQQAVLTRGILTRLSKELEKVQGDETLADCTLGPMGADLSADPLRWRASIAGPIGGPYEGGVFELDIQIPRNYPYGAPRFSFVTKVFHPCVTDTGSIDLECLHEKWSPALTLARIVCHIKELLEYPYRTEQDPCAECGNNEAASLSMNHKAFDERASSWTQSYAAASVQS